MIFIKHCVVYPNRFSYGAFVSRILFLGAEPKEMKTDSAENTTKANHDEQCRSQLFSLKYFCFFSFYFYFFRKLGDFPKGAHPTELIPPSCNLSKRKSRLYMRAPTECVHAVKQTKIMWTCGLDHWSLCSLYFPCLE